MRLNIRKDDFPVYLARGNVKQCFVGKKWPDRVLKVSPIGGRHTPLEIDYFERLERRGIHADCIPKYYGWFQDEQWIGYVQERIEGDTVMTVSEYIRRNCTDKVAMEKVEARLKQLYQDLVEGGVLVLNIHTGNILVDTRDMRMWVIDGFGTPEHIPLPYWFDFCRRRKLKVHWKKFEGRYQRFKAKALREAEAGATAE